MRTAWIWFAALGMLLSLAVVPPARALAGEAEKKAEAPAKVEPAAPARAAEPAKPEAAAGKPAKAETTEKPGGLVGTVIAAVPASKTLVVDVRLGKQVLRVGAIVTAKTKITAGGAPASFDRLKDGARVRIQFRRIATGDEVIAVEVL